MKVCVAGKASAELVVWAELRAQLARGWRTACISGHSWGCAATINERGRIGSFEPEHFLGGNGDKKEVAAGEQAESPTLDGESVQKTQYAYHERIMTDRPDLAAVLPERIWIRWGRAMG